MHCSFAFTTQTARNAPPPPPTQIGSSLPFATASSRWLLGHTPTLDVGDALGEGDAVEVAVGVAVGEPEVVEVGVIVGVGPPVAVAVGVGDTLGVVVGVGLVPPTTQILAASMQALPLNFVRLTTLLL